MTLRVRAGFPSLRSRRLVEAFRGGFAACRSREGFRLVHYAVQRGHVHLIVEAENHVMLGRGMKAVATRIALAVNRVFRRRAPVMARRYHVRRLASPRQVRNALRYVLQNVRKHRFEATGGPGPARIDEASSGRWFTGWKHVARPRKPNDDTGARDVAFPRTWLLAKDWLRHGRIALSEVPDAG